MTENKIIKAFECCSAKRVTECERCPYCGKGCLDKAHADAIDLINRQKEEIERLKAEKDNLIRTYAECQAEVVKEFAERLKTKVDGWYYDFANFDDTMDALMEIDNLAKEFTEGKNEDT